MSWQVCRLGDALTLKRGHDLPEHSRKDGDIPVVSSSGITGRHVEAKALAPGVVTGRYGTIGEVYFMQEDYWPLNTALYVVDFKGNDPQFSAYFLRNILKGYQSEKAAVPGVDRNVLHEIIVSKPKLAVRCRIRGVLSSYDELIENNNRRIKLLEESARLLYQEWFVRLRFPGYEHTRIVDGVPKGWKRTLLGQVAQFNVLSRSSTNLEVVEYIDIASVSPHKIERTVRYSALDAPGRAKRIVRHGDIIWSCVRPNRRSHAVIWRPIENLVASTGFVVISSEVLPTSFLYQTVTTDSFVGFLEGRAKGAAYPAVLSSDFYDAPILVPSNHVVDAFNDFAEPLITLIRNLSLQNVKLRTARDLLLPRLMSGEITV